MHPDSAYADIASSFSRSATCSSLGAMLPSFTSTSARKRACHPEPRRRWTGLSIRRRITQTGLRATNCRCGVLRLRSDDGGRARPAVTYMGSEKGCDARRLLIPAGPSIPERSNGGVSSASPACHRRRMSSALHRSPWWSRESPTPRTPRSLPLPLDRQRSPWPARFESLFRPS
jgi:hypothetical protein